MKSSHNQYLIALLILFFLSVFATNSAKKESIEVSDQKKFIDAFSCVAVKEMEYKGIPASIKLAQGILESNFGKATLAKEANNYFGIKNFGSKDDCFFQEDDDYKDGKLVKSCFRVFDSPSESWQYHSTFLQKKRYASLFTDAKNYTEWAQGLKKAGYATDPKYDIKLKRIIEKYGLYQYDKLGGINVCAQIPINATVFINGLQAVLTGYGASIETVGQALDKPFDRLLRYNDHLFRKEETLAPNTVLFLEPKKRAYDGKSFHYTTGKESWRDISQQYGVKLKNLLAYNKGKLGQSLDKNQRIKLKPETWLDNWRNLFKKKEGKKPLLYIVKKGDTLYSLSKHYKIPIDALKAQNNLETEQLFLGQQLILPLNEVQN